MLISENLKNGKQSLKQLMLVLTFFASFFAVPGYVNNSSNTPGAVNTEVFTNTSSALKNGVSFKRALIATNKRDHSFYRPKESPVLRQLLFTNIGALHHIHLNLLFSGYKSMIQFKMINPVHFSHPDFSNIG